MTSSSERLVDWNAKWKLHGENAVCNSCGAYQRQADQQKVFTHKAECRQTGERLDPWGELDSILGSLPPAK
jgi:hypothetical protein